MIRSEARVLGDDGEGTGDHYVYLYRDTKGRAKYVGYGRSHGRASGHQAKTHNQGLEQLISTGNYSIEIAGPFLNEEAGRAVETALISVLDPECNKDPGPTRWRFRPLGVPESFADRLSLPSLRREDFAPDSVLFVKINDKNFDDGRVGYDPTRPPSNQQILQRMDRYWQLGPYCAEWAKTPSSGPSLLVGVSGKPGGQIIIGAAEVDSSAWARARVGGADHMVPTDGPADLDARSLRGRKLHAAADIKFGPNSNQIFAILGADGCLSAGRPSSRG